jgi:hypothetical protein
MTSAVTDAQIQDLAATAGPATLGVLRWTADRHRDGAAEVELEHQRRMVTLRADGVIAILVPVLSDTLAGLAVMTVGVDEAGALFEEDPCVRAGMMTYEVHPCLTFPGDAAPGTV